MTWVPGPYGDAQQTADGHCMVRGVFPNVAWYTCEKYGRGEYMSFRGTCWTVRGARRAAEAYAAADWRLK